MENYSTICKGCEISQGSNHDVNERGGIIELNGNWILNHYGEPKERFLGWLILQPRFHRMELTDLTTGEVSSLGVNIQAVDRALRQYWSVRFESDLIQRVYVVYFHESVFGKLESSQPSQEWHLHFHLIPRTVKLGRLLRRYSSNGSIRAWSIPEIVILSEGDVPAEYKANNQNMSALLTYLRGCLAGTRSEV